MIPERQNRLARLRAFFAALFLLIAAVSAPIILAVQTSDACGMACCVKEGHCCCSPRHARVEGERPDGRSHFNRAELSSACPNDCSSGPVTARSFARELQLAPVPQSTEGASLFSESSKSCSPYAGPSPDSSSPRGPPRLEACA